MGDVLQAQGDAIDEVSGVVWPGDLDEQLISELLSDDTLLDGLDSAADDSDHCYSFGTGTEVLTAPSDGGGNTPVDHEWPRPAPALAPLSRVLCSTYSGPTIRDIEKALISSARPYLSSRRYSSLYLYGAESRYTTKVRSCGGKVPADGYKWRKYGQKSIKNNSHPRSYYKCTSYMCNAKKHVDKSTNEPEMLIVTYEGSHLHGSPSLLPRLHPSSVMDISARGAVAKHTRAAMPSPTGVLLQRDDAVARDVNDKRLQLRGASEVAEDSAPRAATDSCDDGSTSSVAEADAAAVYPSCTSWSCLDSPWTPGALLL